MNYNEELIDNTVRKLEGSGVVPLDQIYGLTSRGIDYSELDRQHNVNTSRKKLREGQPHARIR